MNSTKPVLNFILFSYKLQCEFKSLVQQRLSELEFYGGLKSLLQQRLSEPEFYGDLVYKSRQIYACNGFNTNYRYYHSSIYKEWVQHKWNATDCMHGS